MQREAKKHMKNLRLPFSFKKIREKKGKKSSSSDNNSNEEHTPINVNGSDNSFEGSSEKDDNSKSLNNFPKFKNQYLNEPLFIKNSFSFEPLSSQNSTPQQARIMNAPYPYFQQSIPQKNLFNRSCQFNTSYNKYQSPTSSNNSGSMSGNITYSGGNNINLSTQTSSNNQMKIGNNYLHSDVYEDLIEK